jgi:3-phosphoshikimate 1-carboxyvinyltransferase
MRPVRTVEILPLHGKKINATLAIPGSKSFTNRALILAAAAQGKTILRNPLFSDDAYWCADALQKMGVSMTIDQGAGLITLSPALDGALYPHTELFIGSAGTTARFLPGILAALGQGEITLKASAQLSNRPLKPLIEALRALGAEIHTQDDGKSFPMTIRGGTLKGGHVKISGRQSSQFISGLLMAAPLAQEAVTIEILDDIVQADYVRMTLQIMREFGVHVTENDAFTRFDITPQPYIGNDIALEADASTATYFFALAAGSGGEITITNLNPNTLQPDLGFVDHLKTLGAKIKYTQNGICVTGSPVIQGGHIMDFKPCSDSTPSMLALAPFASDFIEIRNVKHIRAHECDRLSVMHKIFTQCGVSAHEYEDGLRVYPASPSLQTIDPHDDHRMAMSFAIMGALGNGILILDPACVSKTCPQFFEILQKIGIQVQIHP